MATAEVQCEVKAIARIQIKHPEALLLISGDFNRVSLIVGCGGDLHTDVSRGLSAQLGRSTS